MQTVVSSLLFTLFAGGMTGLAAAQGPAPAAPAAKAPAAKAPAAKEALPQPSANPKDFYVQNPTSPLREIRGTWVTTTGNSAIATAANTAATMKQLADIGLNTVYVETWKNGYTQYPSEVLKRTIGVDRRPALVPQDPSDSEETRKQAARDLLEETLIEAHRNGLIYVGWFEYGFMAAHKSTDNHLRRLKPHWMSRDKAGSEIAPNGFVWMNPLHPEPRRFLLDLVLEAIEKYDMDGVQIDDRIVWPYITMGYDDYTKAAYANEHGGRLPPENHEDVAWRRWRADKVNEYSKLFTQEIRSKHPGVLVSLSPAVYNWCFINYCLEWPKWAAWTSADRLPLPGDPAASKTDPVWDEFIPQVYRFNYEAFEKTWIDQVGHMRRLGANRVNDMLAGIRVVGEGPDATWEDLVKSIELVRNTGGGGHVHWFSRGVLDVYPEQLKGYYNIASNGRAANPHFPAGWRLPSVPLTQAGGKWEGSGAAKGTWRAIFHNGRRWAYFGEPITVSSPEQKISLTAPEGATKVELLIDRRTDRAMAKVGVNAGE
ncbi:MAG: family 10 glycosylhydrolase [Planctomycetaceae bacterium]|jgi:uncharacterized lipoprotein YddW (UPF0748 family)|nr:family 10 glycosylhydrolase [Planctomycetaceae bacterium]